MDIPVPRASGGKRALFVIDAQPATLKAPVCQKILIRIARFVAAQPYDAYVVAEYWAPPESLFARQSGRPLSREEAGPTDPRILAAVEARGKPVHMVSKTCTSCFEGPERGGLMAFLEAQDIAEAHFVGFDINDCVFASLMSAFDQSYWSFLLEELAHHNAGHRDLRCGAMAVLHEKHATNHSLLPGLACDTVGL
jgi:nicotinamidase-related amidase